MAERARRDDSRHGTARSAPRRGAAPARGGRAGVPGRRRSERVTAPRGRYTAPTPRTERHSPPWYPWLLLSLAVVGVGVIIVNYAGGFPHSPSNWYTLGSLVALVAAAVLATNYR